MAMRPKTAGPSGGNEPVSGDADAVFERFQTHMEPMFNQVEKLRQRMKNQYKSRLFLCGAAALSMVVLAIALFTLFKGDADDLDGILAIPMIASAVLFIWAQAPRVRYAKRYKEKILPAVANFFGKFDYAATSGIGMDRLEPSTLIPSHDRYHHEDMFDGVYKDVDVAFCEARLTETRGSGKNRRTVTVFGGVFVLLTMKKPFDSMTVVRRDAGKIGNWLRDRFTGKLEPVKLEDPEFEKLFEVYSDDQVEARYLLTPAFMVRLLDLSESVGSTRFQAAFFGSRLMIMIPTGKMVRNRGFQLSDMGSGYLSFGKFSIGQASSGGLFEPGSIFRPVRASDDFHRLYGEFKAIVNIVDVLKLNEYTGL